ncbi:phenylalanine--tRNA ligase subunit beta [Campylobacter subantarcticus]|uniref:Phenylalanine--tRNA ligase beta subunit n=1 Tax=Campylobacter subantarcticus LMG 24374 TaxID=1388751 RepID=A0A0A8HBZ5_9BACT|nr:phenylalanine--tRNA ligase subunit beta [Campylobacter subantarcticus]AJC91200.1 phenylalanyl-tRNA synthetase, beta subunit [Campylobacter subantarcticus LMG 24374]EAJ1261415.1 phenylalanine--tRNA ligase subunit beta [Campylobacter lari]
MIISKNWLNEWIDLSEISTQTIINTLNSIGLEVDSFKSVKAPEKVVVGKVLEKVKHENSDKLNICKVDVGNEILQIVCGAKNVDKDQFVAVSLVGAVLPGGLEIKPAKLRGVESMGMICSSSELGFGKSNDGIMVLDESMGELVLGKALNTYELFNDEIIEIELTPNRGDCLSLYGVARDLSAALDLNLKELSPLKEGENSVGIGRILSVKNQSDVEGFFAYRALEIKEEFKLNITIGIRLALIEAYKNNHIENLLAYATHASGVVFCAYDFHKLCQDCHVDEKITLEVKTQEHGEYGIYYKDELIALAGIEQEDKYKINNESKIIIIEASYTQPQIIANAVAFHKKKNDTIYRTSRGSEPKLSLGMEYLFNECLKINAISVFSGSQQIFKECEAKVIGIFGTEIDKIIGMPIDKNILVKILKKLGFEISVINDEQFNIKIPLHRSDIVNIADISEEVVRIIGIDNIPSRALEFREKNRLNQVYFDYQEIKNLRLKASHNGYFESIHYVLDNEEELARLGFKCIKNKLINPITNELNTLRSTLVNHLLNAASFNLRNSKKKIKLFECGSVFDEFSNEHTKFAMIFSGYKEEAKIANKAKPVLVDFYTFLAELKSIIGEYSLQKSEYTFLSPYEQANVYKNGKRIGFVGRVHLSIENERDLAKTYICELDLESLKQDFKIAKAYSKFPSMSRDLSVVIPKGFEYEKIKQTIVKLNIERLESFRVVDLYTDENLGDFYSLTINLVFRDFEKTLEDNIILEYIDKIIKALDDEYGLKLR